MSLQNYRDTFVRCLATLRSLTSARDEWVKTGFGIV